jgi:dihydroxyacetone kinase-like protein
MKILENIAKTIKDNEEFLTKLDSAIGDGDHGVNLSRGFDIIIEKLPNLENNNIHEILNDVGNTLLETVGGSVGVLYGSAFMKAGNIVMDTEKILLDDLVRMVEAAENAITSLGHAKVGEKTMLDTIHPFLETLRDASKENLSLMESLKRSVKAAKDGLESTKDMIARKGRAKYFGEKTLGHQDVGATSSYLMIESLLKTLENMA